MPPQGQPLELQLLNQALDKEFRQIIQGVGNNDVARRSNFLSKAIAAFVLTRQAGASTQQAVEASIDGGGDHGIDSVFVGADATLWLIQSKYVAAGVGEPDLGDVSKFRDGIVDLLASKYPRFNNALNAKIRAIERALAQAPRQVRVVLAYTGTAISENRRDIFSDLEHAYNATEPNFVRCFAWGLTSLHGFHLDASRAGHIDAEIVLRDFGYIDQPYRGFYGRLAAKKLAELEQQYGDQVVEKNIRRFKGSTQVNQGMIDTLQQEAQHFFYFNNGVTFLCSSIQQLPPIEQTRQQGRFRVRGLSIINGAQTVGAIAKQDTAHFNNHPAEVLATFVSLDQTPDDFGTRVTQYRNRQNAVDLEDFAALDDRQEGWRQTLSMARIEYLYKHGDDDPPLSQTVFSVREAAPALACCETANHWPAFVVAAKADCKRLFRRPELAAADGPLGDAYSRLFSDALTARELWRVVQISRQVQQTLKDRANGEPDANAKEIIRQGRWLALHVLFIHTQLRWGHELMLTPDEVNRLSTATDAIANALVDAARGKNWNKHYRSVFENQTDCQTIKNLMMAVLSRSL